MRRPRGLTSEERALWTRVAATVRPLAPLRPGTGDQAQAGLEVSTVPAAPPKPRLPDGPHHHPAGGPPPRTAEERNPPPRPLDRHGLDASWDRKLATGALAPDFTLDLHGHSLDAAHARLDHGLTLAAQQGARLVLVITGRPRPVDAADRGQRRGAIRAKLLDWLAAGPHASKVAAVRSAHRKHGGAGALYVVLRKRG